MKKIKIAPSILSADFANMASEIKKIEEGGADYVHCDVMDGVFVPNITFGIKMVEDIRKVTSLPLDVHLMIVHPEKYVSAFAKAGADYITVHYEACQNNLIEVLNQINSLGKKSGIVINPDTEVEKIKDAIKYCDMVLVMSVFPGFGGQKFIHSVLPKVAEIREIINSTGKDILIEIDGGVNRETISLVKESGVDIAVAGSAVFKSSNVKEEIEFLKG